MGCQLEPQGAALRTLQNSYSSNGVLVCGLDRIEHPYDVEDYIRHFKITFPVFVDLGEESPGVVQAGLGSVAVLDSHRRRLRFNGKTEFDPVDTAAVVAQGLTAQSGGTRVGVATPVLLQPTANSSNPAAPRLEAAGWAEPKRLACGKYPRLVSFGTNQVLCVWVAGDVPRQHLEYAVCERGQWSEVCPFSAGEDAHAAILDVDPAGRPVIAWSHQTPEGYRIFLSTYADARWSEPVAVSPAGNDSFRPDLLCDSFGGTKVAWYGWKQVKLRDYPNAWWRSIYVCEVVDGVPSTPRELAELRRGSDDCWDPVITGVGKEQQVSWLRDENPPKLCGSVGSIAGWSRSEPLLAMSSPFRVQAASPIRNRSGRRGLVFEMASPSSSSPYLAGLHVYLTSFVGNRWTAPVAVSSGSGRHLAPVALELANGNYMVLWFHLPGQSKPSSVLVREVKPTGEAVSERKLLVGGLSSNRYPYACAEPSGRFWLAWQAEGIEGRASIYVSSRQ